ncbi:BglG family transcription antiterminator [Paenibacillus sp. NPDC058367]|uniref:BglG family transcription antiterminator n=1 Tax=unclassified Paenibacillus TaxID=185978 RepID=UPI0004F72EEC|nr:BglG family transcription antiterminator [Paenibacillus sp. FSL H7-0737]AIQ26707.1 PTS sugar transporter subunit IIA [Paenibacillus sp. FSL H7-0737]
MNNRQKEIFRILLTESNRLLLVQNLADEINCSEKTIRSDLKIIEEYIERYSNTSLVKRPGRGIYLEIDEADQADLFHRLYAGESSARHESDEERVLHLAYRLLMDAKPVAIQDLASQYFVNKAVIRKDVEKIEVWLQPFNLALISKQRVGLAIEGSEKNKRTALVRLDQLIDSSELTGQMMMKQFEQHEIAGVYNELRALQKRHSLYYTDEAFESLMLHILLMVKRTKLKQPISLSDQEIAFLQKKAEFIWAEEFLLRLKRLFAVSFPSKEAAYLTLRLLGGKFRYRQESEGSSGDDLADRQPLLQGIVEQLTRRMSVLNMIQFSQDQVLMNGLKVHLYTTLNRLDYGLAVSNPMLAEIKKMYPYMFDRVIVALEEMGESLHLSIPEEEAAYLTLHFQASVERLHKGQSNPKKVIIICHMGIGMSQLLRTKIERKFPSVHVEASMAKAEVHDYLATHKVDLVISTVALSGLKIPHIHVSPLLEARDERKLEHEIKQLDEPNNRQESIFLKYTTPFLVFLQQDVQQPDQIIAKLGQVLVDKGYAEAGYSESTLGREKMSSTTIGGGIAIPHGSPQLIKQSVIAIATLKQPLLWGTEKVELVFMLALKSEEREEARQLFKELSLISERPAFVSALSKETDVMKFLSRLKG